MMASASVSNTISLNRFHRLALYCGDCDNYWQLPNYLVVLHGKYDRELIMGLLKINLYMYSRLFDLNLPEVFGNDYNFEEEIVRTFDVVKNKLRNQSKEIKILDIDIIACLEENMSTVVEFILRMKGSFDTMATRIIDNSPKSFVNKLGVLRKNIIKSLESDNIKCAIDNLMDINIAGLDTLVQCVGIIFNCFYMVCIDIEEPEVKTPGVMYCKDAAIVVERLANISIQNFLYKYKRRWLVFYREVLSDCKSLFGQDLKTYNELRTCGNYETIEAAFYDMLILRNPEMMKQLTIIKHIDKYPKSVADIYEWWSGRSKEQLQKIHCLVDDCLGMDKKSTLLPFILTHKMPAKDRMYHEIFNVLKMFDHINPELSSALNFSLRIYPEVFEQVYFPDRERYVAAKNLQEEYTTDVLDNISNKTTLRKCENIKCQARNNGRNVIWNLNTFEVGKHSMNAIVKELIKNPRIFEEILAYAQKNFNVAINANSIIRKPKIIYK